MRCYWVCWSVLCCSASLLSWSATSNADAIKGLVNGTIDFAAVSTAVPAAVASAHPDIGRYVMWELPVVIVYNINASSPCALNATCPQLVLTRSALCGIFKANITSWRDPALTAVNTLLPLGQIRVIVSADADNGATAALTQLCTKVDPTWAPTMGSSGAWNTSAAAGFTVINSTSSSFTSTPQVMAGLLLTTNLSVSYMFQSQAVAYGLAYAQIVNKAGQVIAANVSSVSAGAWEMLANNVAGANAADLTDASNARAYPLVAPGYLLLPLRFTRITCALRLTTINFIRYILASMAATATGVNQCVYLLDASTQAVSNFTGHLINDFVCDGLYVLTPPTQAGRVTGTPLATRALTYLLAHYQDVNSSYAYSFTPLPSNTSVTQLSRYNSLQNNATTDVSVLSAADWPARNGTWSATAVAAQWNVSVMPALLAGVVPIFSLPPAVVQTANNTAYAALSPLYPLTLNVDTLASIFLGQITNWLHPAIVATNPSLPTRFLNTSASTTLTAIVCCSSAVDPLANTNGLASALYAVSAVWRAAFPVRPVPMSWGTISNGVLYSNITNLVSVVNGTNVTSVVTVTSNVSIIANENEMKAAVFSTAGSVGYSRIAEATQDDSYQFRLLLSGATASAVPVPATPAAMSACLTAATFSLDAATLDLSQLAVTGSNGCWPITQLLSYALPASYSSVSVYGPASPLQTDRCTRAKVTLPMVSSFTTSPAVVPILTMLGYWPITAATPSTSTSSSTALTAVNATLNSITCNGASILTVTTTMWSMDPAIKIVGATLVAVLLVLFVASLAVVCRHRQLSIFRSSSVMCQVVNLLGLVLSLISCIQLLHSPPASASCSATLWTVVLAFTLTFAPLFLKVWRIWRIFERRQLTVVSIPDRQLFMVVAALLAVDCIVLALWQAQAPIVAELVSGPVSSSNTGVQYMQCAIPSSSLPYLLVQCVFKGLLLLFGGLMAFSVRGVKGPYNESQVVSWSIYNVLLTVIVVIAVGLGGGSSMLLGDRLLALELVVLLWVPLWTWFCLYTPKFQALYYLLVHPATSRALLLTTTNGHSAADKQHSSTADAEQSQSAAFTLFLKPTDLTAANEKELLSYISHLRQHLVAATSALAAKQSKKKQQEVTFK